MKKTLIAMAVAGVASAPIASADVTVGGKVEQQLRHADSGVWTNWSDVRLTVSGSEDLGNGMSSFFKFQEELGQRTAVTAAAPSAAQYDQIVGIKGDFGTVVAGRMEDLTEGKVMSMVDKTMGAMGIENGNNAGRMDGAVAYVSPAVNGFTVGAAAYVGVSGQEDFADAVDVAIMYANGPLNVRYAHEDSANTYDVDTFGISYAMGDLTLAATMQGRNNDASTTVDEDDLAMIATYTMGNNKLVVGWEKDEIASGTTLSEENNAVIEVQHALSSKTKAYVQMWEAESDTNDVISVGLQHAF